MGFERTPPMNSSLPFSALEDALETDAGSLHDPASWSIRPPRVVDGLRVRAPTRRGDRELASRDLSLTGVFLEGVRASVGTVVPLRMTVPGLEGELSIAGRVVRCDDAAPGVALSFSRIGWEDLFVIARYLAPRL